MASAYDFVQYDSIQPLTIAAKDNSTSAVRNLTNYTVKAKFRSPAGREFVRAMTVTDAANGIAQYALTGDEFDVAGVWQVEILFRYSDGKDQAGLDLLTLNVRARL